MKISRITTQKAEPILEAFLSTEEEFDLLSRSYLEIRSLLNSKAEELKPQLSLPGGRYRFDVELGIYLYQWLAAQEWFTPGLGNDPDFWRYLTVCVAPQVVKMRWDDTDKYYLMKSRNYFRTVWWYIYLSWNGDIQMTREMLLSGNFTTDTVLNLVDRCGKKGFCRELTRWLMIYYSRLPKTVLQKRDRDLFRSIMTLNTARMVVIEPTLYAGQAQGYVKDLFKDSGIDINKYLGDEHG
ncbi:MAG: hypothetical protein HUJ54_13765 [Erysipelotrichaceae bacterium]|nr:hypothetical protein [Erysipelotrichaceae bacterium]